MYLESNGLPESLNNREEFLPRVKVFASSWRDLIHHESAEFTRASSIQPRVICQPKSFKNGKSFLPRVSQSRLELDVHLQQLDTSSSSPRVSKLRSLESSDNPRVSTMQSTFYLESDLQPRVCLFQNHTSPRVSPYVASSFPSPQV